MLNNTDKLKSVIEALKDLDRLNPITHILCPAKKAPSPVKRVTRRKAQLRQVAPIWPLTGETRKPEHVLQPQKYVVHAKVHAPMEQPETEVPLE